MDNGNGSLRHAFFTDALAMFHDDANDKKGDGEYPFYSACFFDSFACGDFLVFSDFTYGIIYLKIVEIARKMIDKKSKKVQY